VGRAVAIQEKEYRTKKHQREAGRRATDAIDRRGKNPWPGRSTTQASRKISGGGPVKKLPLTGERRVDRKKGGISVGETAGGGASERKTGSGVGVWKGLRKEKGPRLEQPATREKTPDTTWIVIGRLCAATRRGQSKDRTILGVENESKKAGKKPEWRRW